MEVRVADLVLAVHYDQLTIQCDTARRQAEAVAAAASLGLITTETPGGFGRIWRVTALGLSWLQYEVDL